MYVQDHTIFPLLANKASMEDKMLDEHKKMKEYAWIMKG